MTGERAMQVDQVAQIRIRPLIRHLLERKNGQPEGVGHAGEGERPVLVTGIGIDDLPTVGVRRRRLEGIAERLMNFFEDLASSKGERSFPELTDREHEVLDLIAQGKNNLEIAQKLVITHKTVRNHVSNIFSKLQVVDRAQAIIRAREAGMGRDSPTKPT